MNNGSGFNSSGFNSSMMDCITLYKSLSPVQLAQVINLEWKAFPNADPGQRIFAPKLYREYAEMLARQLEMASFSAGYVVMFNLAQAFLERFEVESVAYEEHAEYRIPVSALGELNRAIVGRIELVSGFAALETPARRPIAVDHFLGYH